MNLHGKHTHQVDPFNLHETHEEVEEDQDLNEALKEAWFTLAKQSLFQGSGLFPKNDVLVRDSPG